MMLDTYTSTMCVPKTIPKDKEKDVDGFEEVKKQKGKSNPNVPKGKNGFHVGKE